MDGLASCSRIPVQWQETCGDRKNTVWIKLWKASIERQPHGSNGDSMSRRVPYQNTKELGTSEKTIEEAQKMMKK